MPANPDTRTEAEMYIIRMVAWASRLSTNVLLETWRRWRYDLRCGREDLDIMACQQVLMERLTKEIDWEVVLDGQE